MIAVRTALGAPRNIVVGILVMRRVVTVMGTTSSTITKRSLYRDRTNDQKGVKEKRTNDQDLMAKDE
eukprot:4028945-Pyramimonas_sp.AAC.1